jgi:type II secretory pathway pseudopilin PulG
MNNQKHKLKAFTLSELIVVIMITVIVAGIAFSVLQLVQKQMFGIQTNFKHTTSVTLLEQSLAIDALRANHIQYDDLENTLYFISEIDTVSYSFDKTAVQKATDTFDVAVTDTKFYFEGVESNSNKIDAFKLTMAKEYKNASIFIYKRNTANTYMNP